LITLLTLDERIELRTELSNKHYLLKHYKERNMLTIKTDGNGGPGIVDTEMKSIIEFFDHDLIRARSNFAQFCLGKLDLLVDECFLKEKTEKQTKDHRLATSSHHWRIPAENGSVLSIAYPKFCGQWGQEQELTEKRKRADFEFLRRFVDGVKQGLLHFPLCTRGSKDDVFKDTEAKNLEKIEELKESCGAHGEWHCSLTGYSRLGMFHIGIQDQACGILALR